MVGDYERGGFGIETVDDDLVSGSAIIYSRGSFMPPRRPDAEAIAALPAVWEALDAANARIADLTARAEAAEKKVARLGPVAEAALGPALAERVMEHG